MKNNNSQLFVDVVFHQNNKIGFILQDCVGQTNINYDSLMMEHVDIKVEHDEITMKILKHTKLTKTRRLKFNDKRIVSIIKN